MRGGKGTRETEEGEVEGEGSIVEGIKKKREEGRRGEKRGGGGREDTYSSANSFRSAEERRAEGEEGVNVGINPLLAFESFDPIQEILNTSITHTMAHKHHSLSIHFPHYFDFICQ